jgi:ComEC/Rec2-related protein
MATLISVATLFGRSVFSLRNAALAFLVIFFINPFFVMNSGFQLSFAAIFGLLWFFDAKEYVKRTKINKFLHILYLSFMSAFIATIFTLPFTIAHFGYIPIYSLIGNIIILPIFSVTIMPLIMIGTICALFNNHFLIDITNQIYGFTLTIAKHISELPYANLDMPFVSNMALLLSILGLASLIFITKPDSKKFIIKNINYVLCVCCISVAIVLCIAHQKPLFYSTTDNELVGFVINEKLKFNKAKASKHYFAFNSWRNFNNENQSDKNERYKCNHGLCIYKTENWNLAYMQTFTSVMDNIDEVCKDKTIKFVVTPFKIHAPRCNAQILKDGLLIYKNGKTTKIINLRPWHIQHK